MNVIGAVTFKLSPFVFQPEFFLRGWALNQDTVGKMLIDRIYATESQATLRVRKLRRDGWQANYVISKAGWEVWTDKPMQEPEPVFGALMEAPKIVEQLLDPDPGCRSPLRSTSARRTPGR